MSNYRGRTVLLGFAATVVGLPIASLFFEDNVELAATALIALSLAVVVNGYLEENSERIWTKKESPFQANLSLINRLAGLFVGIFLGSLAVQVTEPAIFYAPEVELADAFKNSFLELLQFNFAVLYGGLFFTLFYRSGGLVLILAWNAINWANALMSYVLEIGQSAGLASASMVTVALLPHLLLEVVAYVLAGLTGIFLSRAFIKYSFQSDEFLQVSRAAVFLLLAATVSLLLSVTSEIYIAQSVFHAFAR